MTNSTLYRLAGLSALLAGICYTLVGILHPANIPSSVTTTRLEIVHIIACAMSFFGILGLTGLYVKQAERIGRVGLIGFLLLSVWFVLIMGFSFVEAFVLPHIGTTAPGFVVSWMGMFNSPAGKFDIGALTTVWKLSGVLYTLGGLLFGVATFRAGVFPRWAGALLAAATVPRTARTISTFSWDIVYSASPTASRASDQLENARISRNASPLKPEITNPMR